MRVLVFVPNGKSGCVSLSENDPAYLPCLASLRKENRVEWCVVDMTSGVVYDSYKNHHRYRDIVY